jgi:nucleoside-diphosphate-sugar epimerase
LDEIYKGGLKMPYLVTGGTGLIGSRIVRDLVRQGEQVVAHDLDTDHELMEYVLTPEELKNVKIVQGNILDFDNLLALCKENNVDRIVHTASMMGNADKPILAVHVNTGGMIRILEIARMLNVKKVVYTATNSVFPIDKTDLIMNDDRFRPDGMYGATKAFNEYAAEIYHKDFGLDITGIRVSSMVFGAFQKRGVSASMAIEAIYKPAAGEPGHVLYDDEWAWVYVEDVARAHMLGCKLKRQPGMAGAYNIKGTVIDFPTLIAFVKKLIPDADIKMDHGSLGLKNWDMDMSVTERELGYKPKWDVWDAFKETINETRRRTGLPEV